jgi:nitroimidazol reductase NimA-like FMN-containing flavoprotein (pyridoxamine 5'-phosphate oxidase superfamily)
VPSRISPDSPSDRASSTSVGPWSEQVEEILDGDHAVALAYTTPAGGVVLAPVSNFGLHDRAAGIVTVNSSVGAGKKLERMGRNPHVAIAFHTRAHATHNRPEYVLVQGRASLQPPVADYPTSILEHWERIEPWQDLGPLWRRWLRVYALRVAVRITVERLIVWPDLTCQGRPAIAGKPLPSEAPPRQDRPTKGTAPRVNQARAARRAARLPNVLLGWVGTDGYPFVVPVSIGATDERGIQLRAPQRMAPPGGRRAGLTAHWFSHGVVGQRQMICTGWIESGPTAGAVTYAPHTLAAYRMPSSRFIYRLAVGLFTRLRYRQASKNRAAA